MKKIIKEMAVKENGKWIEIIMVLLSVIVCILEKNNY